MLVIFPVYTSYESQIVLHWQKSLLCWRDSLDLNQVVNKCFSTQVNASNFIMNFTLCLPENLRLLYACNRLHKTSPSADGKPAQGRRAFTSHQYHQCLYGLVEEEPFCWKSANIRKYQQMFLCVILLLYISISSSTLCFHKLFFSLLMRFLFKWGPLSLTCITYENNCCVWQFMRRDEGSYRIE